MLAMNTRLKCGFKRIHSIL